MQVEIWSDVVCPWCAIGKRRFETAMSRFTHRDQVQLRWRSFELDPDAPRERDGDLVAHLSTKYGMSAADARGFQDQMSAQAAGEGWRFDLDRARNGNTLDAHRLLHLAADRGVQDALKERFLAAYLGEGERIGDPATLARLGAQAGLDHDEAVEVLACDRYAEEVRADQRTARALGISGVPFFVVDRRYGVSGAQPPEALLEVLEAAWAAANPGTVRTPAGGTCTDGSCCG